jgi:hypothetical protein
MARKVLGQVSPAATTPTDLYTVPSNKSVTTSTIVVCNTNGVPSAYRVAVRASGEALNTKQYIAYGVILPANSSDYLTLGITLTATDVITVYSVETGLAFSVFGDES